MLMPSSFFQVYMVGATSIGRAFLLPTACITQCNKKNKYPAENVFFVVHGLQEYYCYKLKVKALVQYFICSAFIFITKVTRRPEI